MRVHITVTDDNGNTYEGIADLSKTKGKVTSVRKPAQTRKGAKSAPQVINDLYQNEYFRQGQHIDEVEKKLGEMRYNFNKETIKKALQRAEYLTNRGNQTYIEKYPPS
jgi:hypothetical protein